MMLPRRPPLGSGEGEMLPRRPSAARLSCPGPLAPAIDWRRLAAAAASSPEGRPSRQSGGGLAPPPPSGGGRSGQSAREGHRARPVGPLDPAAGASLSGGVCSDGGRMRGAESVVTGAVM